MVRVVRCGLGERNIADGGDEGVIGNWGIREVFAANLRLGVASISDKRAHRVALNAYNVGTFGCCVNKSTCSHAGFKYLALGISCG